MHMTVDRVTEAESPKWQNMRGGIHGPVPHYPGIWPLEPIMAIPESLGLVIKGLDRNHSDSRLILVIEQFSLPSKW